MKARLSHRAGELRTPTPALVADFVWGTPREASPNSAIWLCEGVTASGAHDTEVVDNRSRPHDHALKLRAGPDRVEVARCAA